MQQVQQTQQFNANHNGSEKVCLICKKVFKNSSSSSSSSSANKSFIRHMQIQHGLSEKGERLIECPVCEKCFFKQQQLERHMHTHEVWVEIDSTAANNANASSSSLDTEVVKAVKKNLKFLSMPDYRDKHSILYCHECIECSLYFKSIKVLAKHKKDKHNLRPVYKCVNSNNDCAKNMFDSVNEFLEHAKVHAQKNIICARCKIKFNNKNSLRNHMKNTHYNHKFNVSGAKTTGSSASNDVSQLINGSMTTVSAAVSTIDQQVNPKMTKKNASKKSNNKKELKMREWPMQMSITNISGKYIYTEFGCFFLI